MAYKKSNYSKNYKKVNKQPNINNIRFLFNVTKPHSLRGVSIKNIEPSKTYSSMRRACNKRAGSNCEICGSLFKLNDKLKKNIHFVETFSYDTTTKLATFNDLLGVCEYCFYILNPYIMDKCVEEHTLSVKDLRAILRLRDNLLSLWGEKSDVIDINTIYALSYKGYKYINDYYPQILKRAITKGVRVLHCPFLPERLNVELYYRNSFD